jgi:predicted nucleic acid-binding protein
MGNSLKRVYWDACTWIALIQDERVLLSSGAYEARGTMCRAVIESAKKGGVEILTSTLNLVEVCKSTKVTADKIAAFFETDYVLLVNLDRAVGERARDLMNAGFSSLKPPDAVHLATAAISPDVEQFHTFDDRLLRLDGLIDKSNGAKLKICKPDAGASPAPLLDAMHAQKTTEAPGEAG